MIPALNEEANISAVVAEVRLHCPTADVLVVDDGSRDGTAARAAHAGAMVVRLPFNLGVGGAMRAGFRYAQRHGYSALVQIDGDGQHDARFLPAVLDALETSDVVIGARFAGQGDYVVRGPRRWAMVVLAVVVSRVARTHLTDVTSGFRAANRRAIRIFADHYPAEYLGDTVESLMIAGRAGLRISQVPVEMRQRTAGAASQSPPKAFLYLCRALFALMLAYVRRWPEQPEELEVAHEH